MITINIFIFLQIYSIKAQEIPKTIPLHGMWSFSLDTAKAGDSLAWYNNALADSILLPGTMDEAKKGIKDPQKKWWMFSRVYSYYGYA